MSNKNMTVNVSNSYFYMKCNNCGECTPFQNVAKDSSVTLEMKEGLEDNNITFTCNCGTSITLGIKEFDMENTDVCKKVRVDLGKYRSGVINRYGISVDTDSIIKCLNKFNNNTLLKVEKVPNQDCLILNLTPEKAMERVKIIDLDNVVGVLSDIHYELTRTDELHITGMFEIISDTISLNDLDRYEFCLRGLSNTTLLNGFINICSFTDIVTWDLCMVNN